MEIGLNRADRKELPCFPSPHAELITAEQRADTQAPSSTSQNSGLNPAKHLLSQCDHRALTCSCQTGCRRELMTPFAANLHTGSELNTYQKLLAPQSCSHDLPNPLILREVFTGGIGDIHVPGFSSAVTLQEREAKFQAVISAQHEAPQTQFLQCLWALLVTQAG